MKVNGRQVEGPNVVTVVLPRDGDEPFVFKARAVLSYKFFEDTCPVPKPPKIQRRGEKDWSDDYSDVDYRKKRAEWQGLRFAFMFLDSISATEGLQWETVKMDDPSTWQAADDELLKAGFNMYEIDRLVKAVRQANCLDDDMVEAARATFFAKQALSRLDPSNSQTDERATTPSGEPANAGESSLQV